MLNYKREELVTFINSVADRTIGISEYQRNVYGMIVYLQSCYENYLESKDYKIEPFALTEWDINKNGPYLKEFFDLGYNKKHNPILNNYEYFLESLIQRDFKTVLNYYRRLPVFTNNVSKDNNLFVRITSVIETLNRIPKDKITVLSLFRELNPDEISTKKKKHSSKKNKNISDSKPKDLTKLFNKV